MCNGGLSLPTAQASSNSKPTYLLIVYRLLGAVLCLVSFIMSQVHYKFQSSNEHDSVTFDGLTVSLADLRNAILTKQKLAQSDDFTLQITNAQTKEVYKNDNDMIPKNTSVTVTRVPVAKGFKGQEDSENMNEDSHLAYLAKRAENTVSMAEEEIFKAMMNESTNDYDASNYTVRPRFQPRAVPPPHYVCNKCGQKGHYITSCPKFVPYGGATQNPLMRQARPRLAHGIPNSYLVPADANTPGAVWTKYGYAINAKDAEAYEAATKRRVKQDDAPVPEFDIPENFICPLCNEIMKDAVKTSCCASHFCDSCIRSALLEDEDQTCPKCDEVDCSPDTLIPDILLRSAISTFLNKTKSGVRRTKKVAAGSSGTNNSPALPGLAERAGINEAAASPAHGSPAHTSPKLNLPHSQTPERSQTPPQLAAAASSRVTESPEPGSSSGKVKDSSNQDSQSTSNQASLSAGSSQFRDSAVPAPSSSNESARLSANSGQQSTLNGSPAITSSTPALHTANSSTVAGPSTSKVSSASHLQPALVTPAASVAPTASMAYTALPHVPYAASLATYPGMTYRPPIVASAAMPYQQFPPGMRPGFAPGYPPGMAPTYPIQMGGRKVLSKEEFYKVKSELLEKQIKAKELKKDPLMDAFGDIFTQGRRRSPSRSRTPPRRSYSRSPVRGRRSYSRSPGRRRSRSPRYYRVRSRSPHRRYYSRSPPPYKDYHRGPPPSDYYRSSRHSEEYYRSSYEYRRDSHRYGDRHYHNGYSDRHSPHDRYRDDRYMSPPPTSGSRYSPRDRKEYVHSPRDRRGSPRRDDGYEDYRRKYEDDPRRMDEDYRRYEDKYHEPRYEDPRDYEERKRYEEERGARSDNEEYSKTRGGASERKPEEERSNSGEKVKKSKKVRREASSERDVSDHEKITSSKSKSDSKQEKTKSIDKKRKRKTSHDKQLDVDVNSNRSVDEGSPRKKLKHVDASESASDACTAGSSPMKVKSITDTTETSENVKEGKSSKSSQKKKSKRDGKTKNKSNKESSKSKSEKEKKKKKTKTTNYESSNKKKSSKEAKEDTEASAPTVKTEVLSPAAPVNVDIIVADSGTADTADDTAASEAPSTAPSQASSVRSDGAGTPQADVLVEKGELSQDSEEAIQSPEELIQAPEPSKWERDDSETDSRQQSPKKAPVKPEKQSPISKKVLESADSLIRNKPLQPLPVTSARRKVTVESSIPSNSSAAKRPNNNDTDSDDSDKRSDLRKKLEKIKQRKYSSSDLSSSEQRAESSKDNNSKHRSKNLSGKTEKLINNKISSQVPDKVEMRRISEDNFEPDYDIEIITKSPERTSGSSKGQTPEQQDTNANTASESESGDSSEEERKRKKKKSSSKSGKHKKHKKHSKKSKKHKKSDR